jgi:CRP-like cAMP-binding protein
LAKKSRSVTRRRRRDVSLHPLSAVELFRGVSEREARKISELCTERRFPHGTTIFCAGDPSHSLYILKSGIVKLISVSEKGSETILHILKPGEIFGELLLSRERRAFTVRTAEDSVVTVISREGFNRLLSLAPTVALNFIQVLSKRLAEVEEGLAESSHTWSYHRLAKVLLHLSEQYGEEVSSGTLITLRLTHEDLANLIGTTRETVTTQLNRFSRMGLLSRRARQIIVTRRRLKEFIRSEELRSRDFHAC